MTAEELAQHSTASVFQNTDSPDLGRDLSLLDAQRKEHETWRQAAQNERADLEAWTLASDEERREYSAYLLEKSAGLDPSSRQLGAVAPLPPAAWFARRRIEVRGRLPWEQAAEELRRELDAQRPRNIGEYLEKQQAELAKVSG